MKKVKSIVKKILGRPERSPFTIDTVAKTRQGYCVIGWYFTDAVTSVEIQNHENEVVSGNLTPIPRDDVKANTGRPGRGFQLVCKTDLDINQLFFRAHLKSGNTASQPLTIKGEQIAAEATSTDVTANVIDTGGQKGSCEFAIVSDKHIYVAGWVTDTGKAANWTIVDNKGFAVTTLVDVLRVQRRDVTDAYGDTPLYRNAGYSILFELDEPVTRSTSLTLCAEYAGNNLKFPIEIRYQAQDEPMTNAMRLLDRWHSNSPSHLQKSGVFGPMLRDIYPAEKNATVTRHDFLTSTETPRASIIIPLYGRYDFMRFQLSYFGRRTQYRDVEILYVVDDPKIASASLKLAREMELISDQPFSLLQLSQNVGFGEANNIGVKHAASDMIVLMNSDVLPKTETWLDLMLATAQRQDTGIVGARLLFEDDTLQHDGMAPMELTEYPGLLFNDHPRKGWVKSLSPYPAEEAECPLLTAACWTMKKADFTAAGGFDNAYVLGDFEDSDLCLKLIDQGKINYIRRDAELYHLERQSQNLVQQGRWKHNVTILNAIYFNQQWQDTLMAMYKGDMQ